MEESRSTVGTKKNEITEKLVKTMNLQLHCHCGETQELDADVPASDLNKYERQRNLKNEKQQAQD